MLVALDRWNHARLESCVIEFPFLVWVYLNHRLLAQWNRGILGQTCYVVPVDSVGLNGIENNAMTLSITIDTIVRLVRWLRRPRLIQNTALIRFLNSSDLGTYLTPFGRQVELILIQYIFFKSNFQGICWVSPSIIIGITRIIITYTRSSYAYCPWFFPFLEFHCFNFGFLICIHLLNM